jgi:hypothetical protein
MLTAVLEPAYGRDYKTEAEALKAFNEGKDFIMCTITDRWVGKPCNKADLMASDYTQAEIRYNGLRDLVIVPLGSIDDV